MSTALTQKTFEPIKERFMKFAKEEVFLKEMSFAIQLAKKSPQLQECNQESIMQSLLNVAQIGLTLNPVFKLAYLIPRWNNVTKTTECYLEPSYQGLVKLLTDTGSIKSINCNVVHENDVFEYELGLDPKLIHKPSIKNKGELIACYAIATLNDGQKQIEVMTFDEINQVKERSESYKAFCNGKLKSTVWVSDESEMWRKTVIRRIVKYLPKSENWERLANAINLDERDYSITEGQIDFINALFDTASISPERLAQLSSTVESLSSIDAEKLIVYLQNNQKNPILHGGNYSQSDINKQLSMQGL